MKFDPDIHIVCKSPEPTKEEIEEYRNEKDHYKRLELAYEYRISSEDLYPEDLKEILDDVYMSMEQIEDY